MTAQERWYQTEAVAAIERELQTRRSTLLVMATGLGKTQVFSQVAKSFLSKGRILCLAHRKELVLQAADRLKLVTGITPGIEMAEDWSGNDEQIVCGSLATVVKRLERWQPDHFALVIFDEAHHSIAKSFRKPIDYFQCAKLLGVTATPDRKDKKAMGKIFDSVAYTVDTVDGIGAGYLVPIRGRSVYVREINLSAVKESAGDLQIGELDEAMVHGIEGIVSKTLELEPYRQGIWFFPGVRSAELACDRINALLPGSAAFVSGKTPAEERAAIMAKFRSGEIRHLCNCQVATEGFDAPTCSMVVIGRPTLSRALYAQMVGRGGRIEANSISGLDGKELASARRAAIAGSSKPDLVVLDFCGNSGKHKLVTPLDILGGDYSDEEVKLAKKKAEADGELDTDMLAQLRAARAQLKAQMAKIQSKVVATVESFDPFTALGMKKREGGEFSPLTRAQQSALSSYGLPAADIAQLSMAEASQLLSSLKKRHSLGLATYKQLAILRKHGVNKINIGFKAASRAISHLAASGWKSDVASIEAAMRQSA